MKRAKVELARWTRRKKRILRRLKRLFIVEEQVYSDTDECRFKRFCPLRHRYKARKERMLHIIHRCAEHETHIERCLQGWTKSEGDGCDPRSHDLGIHT